MASGFMKFTGKFLRVMLIIASVAVLPAAEIIVSPKDTEVMIEETVELHCKATSGNIEWHHVPMGERYSKLVYQDNFIYTGYKERFKTVTTIDGKCNLIINGVKPTDAGKYICMENSETPLQATAELIVFERVPSNDSCSGKYTCKPVCDSLELSCEVKSHGNYIPSFQWIDSGGKSIDATNNRVNYITVSTVKLKSDPYKAVLYTCQMRYLEIHRTSKYYWTYSTSARESSSIPANPGQQPQTESALPITPVFISCFILAIAALIGIASVLIMRKRRKNKQATPKEKSAEESEHLLRNRLYVEENAGKTRFIPCTNVNKGNPIHGLAAIDDEVFIITREGCVVEVFDLHSGRFKRFWPVDGLVNPNDMAACPTKKVIFICDWKRTAEEREIFCLDIHGNLLGRWFSDHERGCISITNDSNVIVANSWYNNIKEYTSTGRLIQTIIPGKDKLHLWQAAKLQDGNFVACIGDTGDDHREICILNEEGRVLNSLRSDSELPHQKPLSVPRSLAVDRNGNIYVCDLYNFRIIVLNPELKVKCFIDTASDGYKLRGPLRICVHDFNRKRWLLVADNSKEDRKWRNGRFVMWNVQDL